MKDFTKTQATRWVKQELASTVAGGMDGIKARIVSMQKYMKDYAMLANMLPVSWQAHLTLIAQLKALTNEVGHA